MRKIVGTACIIAVLLLSGCQKKRQYWTQNAEKAGVEVVRFDNFLLSLPADSAEMHAEMNKFSAENNTYFSILMEDIFNISGEDVGYFCSAFPMYLTDTVQGFQEINQKEQEVFENIDDIEKELNIAFGRLHELLPELPTPAIFFTVGGFGLNDYIDVLDEEHIIVYADMYLGADYQHYKSKNIYLYQRTTMSREYLVPDVLKHYLNYIIGYTSSQSRLLENMIYRGKIMYLLQQLVEATKPWEAFGYTKEMWQWMENYEGDIWRLIMDKKDLYKTETMVLTSYLNDGPFTSEISQECPARAGVWIGMRIVEQYMQNNEDVSMQMLLMEGDAQKILHMSKYKP